MTLTQIQGATEQLSSQPESGREALEIFNHGMLYESAAYWKPYNAIPFPNIQSRL
jgi:hypothetical protein